MPEKVLGVRVHESARYYSRVVRVWLSVPLTPCLRGRGGREASQSVFPSRSPPPRCVVTPPHLCSGSPSPPFFARIRKNARRMRDNESADYKRRVQLHRRRADFTGAYVGVFKELYSDCSLAMSAELLAAQNLSPAPQDPVNLCSIRQKKTS